MTTRLCALEDVKPGGALALDVALPDGPRRLLVVATAGGPEVYLNSCPHTGVRLDWTPGRLFDCSGRYLQCATHGALFDPAGGQCVSGPCAGRGLVRVPSRVLDGDLVVDAGVRVPSSAPRR